MSKQKRDQDEKRAPSGAGKGHNPAAPSESAKHSSDSTSAPSSDTRDKEVTPGADKSAEGKTETPPGAAASADEQASPTPSANSPSKPDRTSGTDTSATKSQKAKPPKAKPQETKGQKEQRPSDDASNRPGSSSKPKTADSSADAPQPMSTTPSGGTKTSSKATDAKTSGTATPPPSGGTMRHGGGGKGGNGGERGGKAGVAALILSLVLLVLLLIGGWWVWQTLSTQQERLARIDANAERIGQLETQFSEGEQQRDQTLQDQLQSLRDEMQQYRDSVDETLDRVLADLASEQQADPSEWIYAEVEYLLRLANQRLQLERDVSGARALLRTADERVAQADNPALTPVRRAIQSELGELGSVPTVDHTGLYLALMAQQEQLAKLPLKQDVEELAAEGGDTSPVEGQWRDQLARFGQELKELVVVRHHDQALEALITPEQESYLRQNVRLQLEQAQLAVLDANPELFQASLDKALALIEGYYDSEHNGVQESKRQLQAMSEQSIRPELPDISGSLQALREFMGRRQDGGSADE